MAKPAKALASRVRVPGSGTPATTCDVLPIEKSSNPKKSVPAAVFPKLIEV
jgi:hypothetical protein